MLRQVAYVACGSQTCSHHGQNFPIKQSIFLDDNTPPHCSNFAQAWKVQNKIRGMTWPAQSPYLNAKLKTSDGH